MLHKLKIITIYIILLLILLFTFLYPNIIINDILESVNIFIYKLFPSMFFIYTISDLLINYNFIKYINIIFDKFFYKIFHISGISTYIIFISLISGFPSGAKYIKYFLDKKMLNTETAKYLLAFTFFSNPLFLLSIINNMYNKKTAYIVLLIHFLSNFILAFIIRPKEVLIEKIPNTNIELSFDKALKESFLSTFKLLIIILGNTIIFYTFSSLLTININNEVIKTLIYGIFDLTKGIMSISNLNINIFYKLLIIIGFISFGGINVNIQVKQIVKEKLDYKYFLFGRICSLAIAIILLCSCFAVGII